MSPAVEAFEELALAGRLAHGGHPILRLCMSNAVISRDPAGNRKLDKSKAYRRIRPRYHVRARYCACYFLGQLKQRATHVYVVKRFIDEFAPIIALSLTNQAR